MSLVTDIRDDLLGLIRTATADITTAQTARILTDINAGVQHIYENAPDFWNVTEEGQQIQAPASLTGLTLTNGATTLSGGSLSAYMHGCTVQLSGESQQNEIRRTGSSTYALAFPYQGSTTAVGTGTVYHDALNLAASATAIVDPVFIPGFEPLSAVLESRDLFRPSFNYTDHGRFPRGAPVIWNTNKETGTPRLYLVERNVTYDNQITTRIRLSPLPDTAYALRYRQRTAPYTVTSLSDTVAYLVPHGYNQSILFPVVRWKFAASVDFTQLEDGASRQRINEDYQIAMRMLRNLAAKQRQDCIAEDGTNA